MLHECMGGKSKSEFEKGLTEFEIALNRITGNKYYYKPALKKDAAKLLEIAKRELKC